MKQKILKPDVKDIYRSCPWVFWFTDAYFIIISDLINWSVNKCRCEWSRSLESGPMMMNDGVWVTCKVMPRTCLKLWGPPQRDPVHSLCWQCFYKQMSGICRDFVLILCVHEFFKMCKSISGRIRINKCINE